MVASLAVRSTFACHSCRSAMIRSFTNFAGVPASASRRLPSEGNVRPRAPLRNHTSQTSLRTYSDRVTGEQQAGMPGTAGLEEAADIDMTATRHPANDESPELPWYLRHELQEEQESTSHKPLSERQRLPDMPDLPPPILPKLLEHISVDIGLDDLSLLDLRALDPPPALGSNLIMVIGTARSEKHLHVSADRFCRYLRSTHKLNAHADGLLGRGELKVRMRRMAKRSRLLANVGALNARRDTDDIRTGWICVMVDGIEPHPDWKAPEKKPGFVGFDERTDKVSLVVQMFTEAKREEIDIEKLWTGRSDRAAKAMDPVAETDVSGGLENDPTPHASDEVTPYEVNHQRPQQAVAG